jgi:hypothetical protein
MGIITACQRISLELTVKGLKKCCISTAMGETADDMLGNVSEVDHDVSDCV